MYNVYRVGKWEHNLTGSMWNDDNATPFATVQDALNEIYQFFAQYPPVGGYVTVSNSTGVTVHTATGADYAIRPVA